MFNLNDLQNKRNEMELVYKANGYNVEANRSMKVSSCSGCSGSCVGSCEEGCKSGCKGCGSK